MSGKLKSRVARLGPHEDEPRHLFRCTDCGHWGHWGPGWLWYGDWIRGASRILCPSCSGPHQHEVIP